MNNRSSGSIHRRTQDFTTERVHGGGGLGSGGPVGSESKAWLRGLGIAPEAEAKCEISVGPTSF